MEWPNKRVELTEKGKPQQEGRQINQMQQQLATLIGGVLLFKEPPTLRDLENQPEKFANLLAGCATMAVNRETGKIFAAGANPDDISELLEQEGHRVLDFSFCPGPINPAIIEAELPSSND